MILGIVSDCGCANLRDVDCLVFILDVGMDCNLDALVGQGFKSNYGSSFQNACVKLEDYFHTALRLLSGKCGRSGDRFAINQDRLSCLLIHQGSGHCVFLTRQ